MSRRTTAVPYERHPASVGESNREEDANAQEVLEAVIAFLIYVIH
jgi:hypothetical protein